MSKRKVEWTKTSLGQLKKAIEYIRLDSEQNADKVKEKLLSKINELENGRITHRKDPYKKNNDGNFLFFEYLKYRVVYYSSPGKVSVVRIRHTTWNPENINYILLNKQCNELRKKQRIYFFRKIDKFKCITGF